MKSEKTFYRIIIPFIIVLAVVLAVLVAMTFKKQRDERLEEISISQSQALAERIVTVTIPEGYCVSQIAQKLEENEVVSQKKFLAYVKTPPKDVIDKLKIGDTSKKIFVLEGYLYPDTYEFYKNEDVSSVVSKFLDNFSAKVTDKYYDLASSKGYTMDEILTIASIIQKEAGMTAENAKVSSVIYNRLKSSMQIQCDVTTSYLEKYVKPFVDDYKEEYEENYDTFKCEALPAGPLCNSSIECIQAALNPAETSYMFFVTDSKDMSKFYYAQTYEQHLVNCRLAGYSGY